MNKIVFIDIDGTIFHPKEHYISELSFKTIEQLKKNDCMVFLNSSRSYDEIKLLPKRLFENNDYILYVQKQAGTHGHDLKFNFKYNEKPEFTFGEDMINDFLFETKEGFCQQFATTMALMLRSVDIPSRFVTGYVISSSEMDLDEIPDEILYDDKRNIDPYKHIYDNDAHTWVEIYIPSFGWIQFEPTPGQNAVQFSDPLEFDYNPNSVTEQSAFSTIMTHDYFILGIEDKLTPPVFYIIFSLLFCKVK
jgi:hypothetical protein